MTSYEALINKLNDWCTAQIQDIKFYGEFREQMPNLATITEVYPLVFVSPVSSSGYSQFGTNTIDYTVDVYCVDIIQKNRGNINHIVSDCQLILNDIYVYYASDEDDEITVVGTPQVIPMNNADLDYVAGAVMTITFQVEGYTACAIPMNPITPGASLCEDVDYTISDTDGTVLYSGSVASGGTLSQTITDSVATLKDSAGVVLSNTSILAEGTADITAPDGVVTIKNSATTVIDTVSVKSNGTAEAIITDSTAVVKNSAGTTLITESIPAEVSENIIVGDLDITINGSAFTTTPAEVDVNIVVKDTAGTQVGSKVGSEWIVPEAGGGGYPTQPWKTGQTTSYYNDDDGEFEDGEGSTFSIMEANNVFGNLNRYTDTLGGQTYANNIVLFHDLRRLSDGAIIGFDRALINGVAETWTAARDRAAAHSNSGFTGWRLPNRLILYRIMRANGWHLSYTPLNSLQNNYNWWTSTIYHFGTTNAYVISNIGIANVVAISGASGICFPMRYFTLAELGL